MASKTSTVALIASDMDKYERDFPKIGGGLPVPRPHEWVTSTGIALSDPEYLRAYALSLRMFKAWFRRKAGRNPIGRADRRRAFSARYEFWSHVVADYALWCRVDDSLRPASWPKNSSDVARGQGLSLGELSLLLGRVQFKRYLKALFPPIPSFLFIDRLDKMLMRQALNEEFALKRPREWLATADLAYKRYGTIKTGGAGIQINNANVNGRDVAETRPDEQQLAEALKLVAPYMPRLIAHTEVPVAEEESRSARPDHESIDAGDEHSPEGSGSP